MGVSGLTFIKGMHKSLNAVPYSNVGTINNLHKTTGGY